MNIFKTTLLFFYLILNNTAQGQDSETLLWEVTGNGIKEASYIFGSIHLNDRRIFNFGDSLYYALSNCNQFANEVDMAILDDWIQDELNKEFLNLADRNKSSKDEEDDETNIFDVFDPLGMPTFMDMYLMVVARKKGLSTHGLEEIESQVNLDENIIEDYSKYQKDSPAYKAIVEAYLTNNLSEIENFMSRYDEDSLDMYQMVERNKIQAASFEKLALIDKTFAVVGAAHLVGEDNVLENLVAKGYRIRSIGKGNETDKIDSIYFAKTTAKWTKIESKKMACSILSNQETEFMDLQNIGDMHFNMDFGQGLIYFSMLFPNVRPQEDLESLAYTMIGKDTTNILVDNWTIRDGKKIYQLTNKSDKDANKLRISVAHNVIGVQFVMGFSHSALNHPYVEKYFDGLVIEEDDDPSSWAYQTSTEAAFDYYFPDNIDFINKNAIHPDFPDRGDMILKYKIYTDTTTKDEYLLRYNILPPGILYVNPYETSRSLMNSLASAYNADLTLYENSEHYGLLQSQAEMVDSFNNIFYLQTLIRGSNLYLQVQKAVSSIKNESFFDGLKIIEKENPKPQTITYEASKFTIYGSQNQYKYQSHEDDGTLVENIDFNFDNSGINVNLEIQKYDKYDEINLNDSLFTIDNVVDFDAIDSLIAFKPIKYEGVCPGYQLQHKKDSAYLYITEIAYYCNNHFTSITITAPQNLLHTGATEEIIKSINFEIDENSINPITSAKNKVILEDLKSQDSSIFHAALEVFNEYENFKDSDLQTMFDLMHTSLLNDSIRYNAKYDIISKLHSFENPEVESFLAKYYDQTSSEFIKYVILESFSKRYSATNIDHLISLLLKTSRDQYLPEDVFQPFTDSLALLQKHYFNLQTLADNGVGTDLILNAIVYYLENDTINISGPTKDDIWFKDKMYDQIDIYYANLEEDSTFSTSNLIMDYFLLIDDPIKENELYNTILSSPSNFGKYRIIYNQIKKNKDVSDELVDEVFKDDYYRYWLLNSYEYSDYVLPLSYFKDDKVTTAIIKNYINDNLNYWCESCAIYKEKVNTKKGVFNFMKCAAENEGEYYFGAVGPFAENGLFKLKEDDSLYFNTIQKEENTDVLVDKLIQYINEEN